MCVFTVAGLYGVFVSYVYFNMFASFSCHLATFVSYVWHVRLSFFFVLLFGMFLYATLVSYNPITFCRNRRPPRYRYESKRCSVCCASCNGIKYVSVVSMYDADLTAGPLEG